MLPFVAGFYISMVIRIFIIIINYLALERFVFVCLIYIHENEVSKKLLYLTVTFVNLSMSAIGILGTSFESILSMLTDLTTKLRKMPC